MRKQIVTVCGDAIHLLQLLFHSTQTSSHHIGPRRHAVRQLHLNLKKRNDKKRQLILGPLVVVGLGSHGQVGAGKAFRLRLPPGHESGDTRRGCSQVRVFHQGRSSWHTHGAHTSRCTQCPMAPPSDILPTYVWHIHPHGTHPVVHAPHSALADLL